MRIKLFPFFCLVFTISSASAQSKSYSAVLSAGFNFPVRIFAQTHIPGISIEFAAAKRRYGRMPAKPAKKFAFAYGGGLHYYFGNKEIVSGYPYRYPAFIFINVAGGAIYNPHKKANISLTAGPALSRYNGSTRFNITAALSASYYFTERWGITPALLLINETGARPLWSAGLKASYTL
ncbi:MAG: hypothetical protein ACT4OJ_09565 [Bacteroidota bacterium]